jgi:dienelactone hydrolase
MRSTVVRVLVGALAAAAVTGCSSGTRQEATAAPSDPPAVGADCPAMVEGGKQVTFANGSGASLTGVVFGTGSTGVVLSHMSDGDVCAWLPYARQLARSGYQALAYYFAGFGTSGSSGDSTLVGDVGAAAGYLRTRGATRIALVGASMGAAASLDAATVVRPAPALVISLSSPSSWRDADPADTVKKLTVPVLYAAAQDDGQFAVRAQELYAATPASTERSLMLLSGQVHGIGLVGVPGTRLRDAMDHLFRERAPAGG